MSETERTDGTVPLSDFLRAAGLIALTVTGVVIFMPTLLYMLLLGGFNVENLTAWLIPVGVWTIGFVPGVRQNRPMIQAGAGVLLMLMAALVPGAGWIPVSSIAFAVVVAAIFTLPTRSVVILIGITSLLEILMLVVPSGALIVYASGPVPILIGPALQIIAGGGLLFAWQRWKTNVEESDRQFAQVQRAAESVQRERARLMASAAVERRIHETILNTLAAISFGVTSDKEAAARAGCKHDLDQLQLGLHWLPDCTIGMVVDAALSKSSLRYVDVDLNEQAHVSIPASVANPLHDGLVEALRNIERHAHTDTALIEVFVDGEITFHVGDSGVGINPEAVERFGVRNTIRSGLMAVGGRADIRSVPTGGTLVELTVPLTAVELPLTRRQPLLGAVDASVLARLGVMGTNIFMLLFAGPVANSLPRPPEVITAIGLTFIALLALAFAWQTRLRTMLAVVATIGLLTTLIITAAMPLTCDSEWAVVMLLTGMSGGATLLPVLGLRGWGARIALAIAMAGGSFTLALAVPEECRLVPLVTAFATVAYLTAFVVGLTWTDEVFERRRDRVQSEWDKAMQELTEDEGRQAEVSGWNVVGPAARGILEGVADGSLSLSDPSVRARAAVESAGIREALGLAQAASDALGQLSRQLVHVALETGAKVECETLTTFTRLDAYPEGVIQFLETLVRNVGESEFVLRAFADAGYEELVVRVPGSAITDTSARFIDDCSIQIDVDSDEAVIVVRRRAAAD